MHFNVFYASNASFQIYIFFLLNSHEKLNKKSMKGKSKQTWLR